MKKLTIKLNNLITSAWYSDAWWPNLFIPLSWLYAIAYSIKKNTYKFGLLKSYKFSTPVMVVGNICVGGSNKTPLVIAIVKLLEKNGYKVGVVAKGYGGSKTNTPQKVTKNSIASEIGDEALLLANNLSCPIMVGKKRVEVIKKLLQDNKIDIVVSDDGLQHMPLIPNIKLIALSSIFSKAKKSLLPVGPLREPLSALKQADLILHQDKTHNIDLLQFRNLKTNITYPLDYFAKKKVQAISGIANPIRFFEALRTLQVDLTECISFPDHYKFSQEDFNSTTKSPIIMTAKDAVKCSGFVSDNFYCLDVAAKLATETENKILTLVKSEING